MSIPSAERVLWPVEKGPWPRIALALLLAVPLLAWTQAVGMAPPTQWMQPLHATTSLLATTVAFAIAILAWLIRILYRDGISLPLVWAFCAMAVLELAWTLTAADDTAAGKMQHSPFANSGAVVGMALVLGMAWSHRSDAWTRPALASAGLVLLASAGFMLVGSGSDSSAVLGGGYKLAAYALILCGLCRGQQRKWHQRSDPVRQEAGAHDRHYRTIINSAPDVILLADAEGMIRACNNRCEQLFGYERAELIGKPVEVLLPERYRERHVGHRTRFDPTVHGHAMMGGREILGRHRDGSEIPLGISLSPLSGDDSGRVIAFIRDIRERVNMRQALMDQARRDALTELPNRMHFTAQLAQTIASTGDGLRVGVILVGLDNFKSINESRGHPYGDQLLVLVARALGGLVPGGGVLARMGGDEFAILLPELEDAQPALDVCTDVLEVLRRPFELDGHSTPSGASMGIALYPDDADDHDGLLRRADIALFQAKSEGRGCVRRFDRGLEVRIADRFGLQSLLLEALAEDQFRLHYQPQVSLTDGHICGFEALLRWTHPVRGPIDPGQFVPVAEASGLIVLIGNWVLDEACRQIGELHRRGIARPIAVNLSAHQLHQSDLVQRVSAALQSNAIPAQLLELELTESAVMRDPHRVTQTLQRLSELGVRLALDDFGTGYSSLAYLKDFPLHKLKVDRSFIVDLEGTGNGVAIVKGVIGLAHSLGLTVLAEGVETERQRIILQQAGCDEFQGWLFSRALPEDALWPLLSGECVSQ